MSEDAPVQAPAQGMDDSFNNALMTTSRSLAGSSADQLVTPAYGDALTDLITSFINSCFGGSNPAPGPAPGPAPTPTSMAYQMANLTPIQRSVLRTRAKRHMLRAGLSHEHGMLAASTIIQVGRTYPQDQLAAAISHVKDVDSTFPQVDMF